MPFHITCKARPGNICNGEVCSSSFWLVNSPHSSKSPLMSGSHTTRGCREKPPPELHSELLQLKLQSSPQRPTWSCLKILPHLPLQECLLEQQQVPLSSGGCGGAHTGRAGEHFPAPSVEMKACGFKGISTHSSVWKGQEVFLFQFGSWWRMWFTDLSASEFCPRICPNSHTKKVPRCGSYSKLISPP